MDFRAHCSLVITLALLCIFCCCSCPCAHGGTPEELQLQPSAAAALVTGTVYCDTCFPQPPSKPAHFISGASVAVECGDRAGGVLYRKVVRTNRHGVFRSRLPPKVSKHVDLVEACSVKLIESSEPFCAVASSATTTGRLRLKSRSHGVHVYSAGFFTFKPLNQPELCYQKPRPEALLRDQKAQEQPGFFVPLPTISIFPSPAATTGGGQVPANPFFPPQLPTNPFFPPQSNALQPPLTAPSTAAGAQLPTNPFFPPRSTALRPRPARAQLPTNPFFPPRAPSAVGGQLPTNPFFPPRAPSAVGGGQLPTNPFFRPRAPSAVGGGQLPTNPFFPPRAPSAVGGGQLPTNPFFPPRSIALQPPPAPSAVAGAELPTNPFLPPQSTALQPPPPSPSSGVGVAQLPPRFNLPQRPWFNLPQPPLLGLPSFPRPQPPPTSFNFPPVASVGAAPSPPAGAAFLPNPSTTPLFQFPRFPGAPPASSAKKASP